MTQEQFDSLDSHQKYQVVYTARNYKHWIESDKEIGAVLSELPDVVRVASKAKDEDIDNRYQLFSSRTIKEIEKTIEASKDIYDNKVFMEKLWGLGLTVVPYIAVAPKIETITPEAVEASWSKLTFAQQEWWKGFFDNARYVTLAKYKIAKPYPPNDPQELKDRYLWDEVFKDKDLINERYVIGVDPCNDNLVRAEMRTLDLYTGKETTMAGYIQNAPQPQKPLIPEEMFEPTKSKAKIGDTVLVYPGPGQDPIEGIIKEIDMITGIILSVLLKDGPTKDKVISVKNKVVLAVPIFYSLFKLIKSWFKKRN